MQSDYERLLKQHKQLQKEAEYLLKTYQYTNEEYKLMREVAEAAADKQFQLELELDAANAMNALKDRHIEHTSKAYNNLSAKNYSLYIKNHQLIRANRIYAAAALIGTTIAVVVVCWLFV